MTTGQCIIDGVDIATFGAFIERDGSNDLLVFPERRRPDENDWSEHDGLEVDLEGVTFEPKKVVMNYVLVADNYNAFKQRLKALETLHFQPGNRSIYIREFDSTFQLRFSGFSSYSHKGGYYNPARKRAKISVEYWMDDPLQMYTTAIGSPVGPTVIHSNVAINGIDLSKYGIIVNEVYSSALRPRSVKDVLIRKVNNIHGQIVDSGEIGAGVYVDKTRKSKEISIDCTMIADTANQLKINLNALFNVVSADSPVSLKLAYESSYCYYVKMSRFRKRTPFSRKVSVEFTLHMREMSWRELVRLFATQNGLILTTQDGKFIKAI